MLPLRVLAVAVLLFLAASPVSASVTADVRARAGDTAAQAHAHQDAQGIEARASSPLGAQRSAAEWRCVPDEEARCETKVDCAPGTLDCAVTRQRTPPPPGCTYQPDGSLHCTGGNGTAPRQTGAQDS